LDAVELAVVPDRGSDHGMETGTMVVDALGLVFDDNLIRRRIVGMQEFEQPLVALVSITRNVADQPVIIRELDVHMYSVNQYRLAGRHTHQRVVARRASSLGSNLNALIALFEGFDAHARAGDTLQIFRNALFSARLAPGHPHLLAA